MKLRVLFYIGFIAVMPGVVLGGVVTPLSSNRTVTALNRETIPQTQVSFTGPAVGLWQATAQVSNLNFSDPNFNPNGALVVVTSSQQSMFSSAGISFSGFVIIDYSFAALPQLGTSVSNRCDTVFHVEGNSDYQFQAAYSGQDFFNETVSTVFLRNNSTSQTLFSITASDMRSGTLPTGDYTLSILISGGTSGSQIADARRQIDATFTIPAPAAGFGLLAPLVLATRRRRSLAAHS